MAKRAATTQLTDRNWEEEDPQEEAGTFSVASGEKLAKRQIKKAKRRVGGTESDSGSPAFKGFSGFAGLAESSKVNFGEMQFKSVSNGTNTKSSTPSFGAATFTSSQPKPVTTVQTPEIKITPTIGMSIKTKSLLEKESYNSEYCKRLKELNKSVSAWIEKHVATNPLCDLTPIFQDYEKHLRELEKKYPPSSSESETEKEEFPGESEKKPSKMSSDVGSKVLSGADTGIESMKPTFKFGSVKEDSSKDTAKSGFQFGSGIVKEDSTKPSFQFGSVKDEPVKPMSFSFKKASDSSSSEGKGFQFPSTHGAAAGSSFSFGAAGRTGGTTSGSGFSFGVKQPSSSGGDKAAEKISEDETPPKNEFTEVKEDDAQHSVRCKLFFKKEASYCERGVGMLYLKKIGNVLQLLIRADTNLGNILLNIGVPPSIPVSRQGKNNLLLVAPANPPVDKQCPMCEKKYVNPQESNKCESGCKAEAVPLLIRVKTGDMADELLNKINELKE
ncbi:nuclear pore complex protein Nup50-like [Saccoglossus kowalevskii]|uniref:Nuclear pore complex protein Nup50-like n=1 Tax=Saccoglossus kowalevskii TaxID=10224 RepID=A0ABM0GRR2_SACKO|nr:PREDICTED: nuclear pore complex protein Nup50-like [Saccoglossus kowalevskii]